MTPELLAARLPLHPARRQPQGARGARTSTSSSRSCWAASGTAPAGRSCSGAACTAPASPSTRRLRRPRLDTPLDVVQPPHHVRVRDRRLGAVPGADRRRGRRRLRGHARPAGPRLRRRSCSALIGVWFAVALAGLLVFVNVAPNTAHLEPQAELAVRDVRRADAGGGRAGDRRPQPLPLLPVLSRPGIAAAVPALPGPAPIGPHAYVRSGERSPVPNCTMT